MYTPDTCPVCGNEYTDAMEFDNNTSVHSGGLDSRFCLLGGEDNILVYLHDGYVTEL